MPAAARSSQFPPVGISHDFSAVIAAPFGAVGIIVRGQFIEEIRFLPPGQTSAPATNSVAAMAARQLESYLADPDFRFDLPLAGRGGLLQILAEQGALDSLKARLLGTPAERGQAAARAVSSLTAVLKERPPLGRELEPYLRAAEPLLATAAPTVEISLHTELEVR